MARLGFSTSSAGVDLMSPAIRNSLDCAHTNPPRPPARCRPLRAPARPRQRCRGRRTERGVLYGRNGTRALGTKDPAAARLKLAEMGPVKVRAPLPSPLRLPQG